MVNRLKLALRRSCRQVRESLSLDFQRNASLRICNRIRSLESYRHAKRIALYQAIGGEVDLSPIWNSAPLQGKFCYFPSLNDHQTLLFLPATPVTAFVKNRYGIAEPDIDKSHAIEPKQLDLIFTPLVAFDVYGTRLGMGAGYYDRTLSTVAHPLLIGVAYEFQRHAYIQREPWDIPLAAVITEKAIYWSKKID